MRSRVVVAIAALGALALAPGLAAAQSTTCTSFESFAIPLCGDEALFPGAPAGDFSIGVAPRTASFQDGQVMTVGVGAYYHSGARSWHIPPSTTATILFETRPRRSSSFSATPRVPVRASCG